MNKKEQREARYRKNRTEVLAKQKAYDKANRARISVRKKDILKNNGDEIRAKGREYYAENKHRLKVLKYLRETK